MSQEILIGSDVQKVLDLALDHARELDSPLIEVAVANAGAFTLPTLGITLGHPVGARDPSVAAVGPVNKMLNSLAGPNIPKGTEICGGSTPRSPRRFIGSATLKSVLGVDDLSLRVAASQEELLYTPAISAEALAQGQDLTRFMGGLAFSIWLALLNFSPTGSVSGIVEIMTHSNDQFNHAVNTVESALPNLPREVSPIQAVPNGRLASSTIFLGQKRTLRVATWLNTYIGSKFWRIDP